MSGAGRVDCDSPDSSGRQDTGSSQTRAPRRAGVSIGVRLAALVLVAVLPVAGIVLVMADSWRDASQADAAAGVVRLAEAAAVHQENLLLSTSILLEALAHSNEIGDRAACAPFLADLQAQRPEFGVMGVADAQGDFWCSSLPTDGPISVADRDYFVTAEATGGPAVGGYQIGRVTGRPTVALAHPLPSANGQFAGTVIASVDLSRPAALAERLDLPEGSLVTVFDREGTVLMRWPHDEGLIGTDASEHLAKQRPGTAARTSGLDGVERVEGATTLHQGAGQLTLTLAVPVNHLETAVTDGLQDAALQLAAVTALALALAVLMGRRMILRPARRLIETVRQVGSGDLSARTSEVGGGEFAEIAAEFDSMTTSLQVRETELRAAEQRAASERATNAALEEAVALKDDFVAIASHELRTPVTVLQGFLHTIDQRWEQLGPDELRGFIEVLGRNTDRLGELVEDLLLVSRLEGGTVSAAKAATVHVQGVVEESIAASRMASCAIDVEVTPGLVAHANPGHLARVLTNLFDNAVKYGRAPYQCRAFPGPDGTVQLLIVDHGDGVSDEFVPHLFEKFTRAPETAAEQSGTGLGLAIVATLAEAMGGGVAHERTDHGATCFTVTVPCR
jgi:signal transduction histidine kinase